MTIEQAKAYLQRHRAKRVGVNSVQQPVYKDASGRMLVVTMVGVDVRIQAFRGKCNCR